MSDSSTGGYLLPITNDFNVNHVLHDWIVGITGISNTLVRPMYQPNPPTIPSFGTNWIAYNVRDTESDGFAYQGIVSDSYDIKRQMRLILTVSFYGINSFDISQRFKQSVELTQNWKELRQYSLAFGGCGNIIRVPELHNLRWLDRYNIEVTINRSNINQVGENGNGIIPLESVVGVFNSEI